MLGLFILISVSALFCSHHGCISCVKLTAVEGGLRPQTLPNRPERLCQRIPELSPRSPGSLACYIFDLPEVKCSEKGATSALGGPKMNYDRRETATDSSTWLRC